eukprot:8929343-Pyramimonas_sp.AAC.1
MIVHDFSWDLRRQSRRTEGVINRSACRTSHAMRECGWPRASALTASFAATSVVRPSRHAPGGAFKWPRWKLGFHLNAWSFVRVVYSGACVYALHVLLQPREQALVSKHRAAKPCIATQSSSSSSPEWAPQYLPCRYATQLLLLILAHSPPPPSIT